jgi:hypothetical protein
MEEVFVPVVGFPDYQISNKGNLLSKKITDRIMVPSLTRHGYNNFSLKDVNGKRTCKGLHVLVAEAFIPNPQNKSTVNHIDENKLNNCVENLEWATQSEQKLHSPNPIGKSGMRSIYERNGKYRVMIRRNNKLVYRETFDTIPEAIKARDDFLI